ncbi:DUF2459 domain-containing protein [Lichenicoccus roseus]|uniref:DUF2459 domain-containing protein n=1 Tax=Lichenicoccus roseus TaxID=2683649 RepID=UPI00148694C8|nr:DUF2459 domain-containing protein [Lichenicoccus roseus]
MPGALPPDQDQVTVIDQGWHTSIALPARELSGGLAVYRRIFPGAAYFVFGFGKRTFMIAPVEEPGEWLLGPFPGPGAIQVEGLSAPASVAYLPPVTTVTLPLPADGAHRIAEAIWDSLRHEADGMPVSIAARPWHGTLFYATTASYGLDHTCNAWTMEMLQRGGALATAGSVVLASQVMYRVRDTRGSVCPLPPGGKAAAR